MRQPRKPPVNEDLDREIQELERDRKKEEIRQLKVSGRAQWITPTALAAMLPLLAGFGIWAVGEIKQYSKGYQALEQLESIEQEKKTLQEQKNSLYIEVGGLLDLKRHYAEQAKELEEKVASFQTMLDATVARVRQAAFDAEYALGHVQVDEAKKGFEKFEKTVASMPADTSAEFREIVSQYGFAIEIIGISNDTLSDLNKTLTSIPTSAWVSKLAYMPAGYYGGRNLATLTEGSDERFYDLDAGRFLSGDEAKQIRDAR